MVEKRWNPWRALRGRPHIEFALVPLPDVAGGGLYAPQAEGWAALLLDENLTRPERAAALAHELVHDEWGGGCSHDGLPDTWRAVICRHEQFVEAEVARRLVPVEELAAFCKQRETIDLPTMAHDVAEHFDVPDDVAGRALAAFCLSQG